jgi:serine/threonine protein kinase
MLIDGFLLQEKLHQGGMATVWSVVPTVESGTTRENTESAPLLMKIPILGGNDDPTAIVGFEVEQMIMPKLAGAHVPRFIATGDFTSQPYIVMERIGGDSLRARFNESPLPPDEVAAIGATVPLRCMTFTARKSSIWT